MAFTVKNTPSMKRVLTLAAEIVDEVKNVTCEYVVTKCDFMEKIIVPYISCNMALHIFITMKR